MRAIRIAALIAGAVCLLAISPSVGAGRPRAHGQPVDPEGFQNSGSVGRAGRLRWF